MVSRHAYMLMMLGAAGGLPYAVSSGIHSDSAEQADSAAEVASGGEAASHRASSALPLSLAETSPRTSGFAATATGSYDAAGTYAPAGSAMSSGSTLASSSAPAPRGQSVELSQFINFAVTPAWILAQWPRVSASLAEIDLQGYRVPLVTGTQENDLAGSLTYYFDHQQRVARITFSGSTGDPRKLISLVTGQFGFVHDASDDPATVVYAVKWNKRSHSELRIRPVKIVRADDPRNRYDLDLSIRSF